MLCVFCCFFQEEYKSSSAVIVSPVHTGLEARLINVTKVS